MKLTMTAIALAMAGMTVPATAAYAAVQEEAAEAPTPELSKNDRKVLAPLQEAMNAGDMAAIDAAFAAAVAGVDTADGKYVLAQLRLKHGIDNDLPAQMEKAVDEMAASGTALTTPAKVGEIYRQLGSMRYQADDYEGALRLYDKAVGQVPTDTQAIILRAEALTHLNRTDEAMKAYMDAIGKQRAAGQPVDENWYRRAIVEASDAGRPEVIPLSRMWLSEYPTDENWASVLGFYHNSADHTDEVYLNLFRLRRAVAALSRAADYADYAQLLLLDNNPGEALSVLTDGQGAGMIDEGTLRHKELMAAARAGEAESERGTLDADAERAKSRDTGVAAYNIGNLYYGYGDYAKAAEMFAVAVEKGGVDADRAKLRLGMALARAGDAEGAKAALGAVTGTYATLAQYWMLYADTRL
ncbi:tetratricopeptide repeat protein [Sphingomicrobium marinum]|uniref:tetratricopeptide repeat protein n=1 Tax=Sphingomicrobium marinum TaxID=1227950 RepID=UPI00223EFA40|nr:tetratricopeptide repeat protein [Sphingomicrobium marinum]